ncbi:DNA alkylation repair protein [Candidatus Micrarchaeota archaeon]|nr:DNA alkylation repair protein [Candidatus Micrarchaeota archaeon]
MIRQELGKLANPEKAKILQGFFKTEKGQYGEGDIFIGVSVPETRAVAKKYRTLKLDEVKKLLDSRIHEERLAALLILVEKYGKNKKKVYEFYLKNSKKINNWDLVDLSAPKIVGNYLLDKDRKPLYRLAKSKNLWERRIAIVATYAFIKNNQFEDTLRISESLLEDRHDLIHKAAGWMLREIGKRNQEAEEEFLKKHCRHMPRTMLRYAIEKFDGKKKMHYMEK